MTCNNPNLDLVNMNVYKKFGENLSICSQDIEQKQFWHKSWAITLVQNVRKMTCNNPNLELVNMNAYIKFGENLSICSEDIERKRFWHKSRAITLVQICKKGRVTIPT